VIKDIQYVVFDRAFLRAYLYQRLALIISLPSGEDVLISGFGKFCVKDKKERK
jgi:nucleoid DNA-binding protein